MPLVRYEYEWASNLSTDPTTGRPNREAPPAEVKLSGLKYNQPEPYEWYNYQHWKMVQGLFQIEDEYTAADAAEQQARIDADNQLQSNIDQEQSDRENADTDLQQQIDALEQAILQKIYPVGKYYITEDSVNPATQLGFGTWTEVEGRFLVGQDTSDIQFDIIGEEGGDQTHNHTANSTTNTTVNGHALTIDEMPAHTHDISYRTSEADAGAAGTNLNSDAPTDTTMTTQSTGGGDPHSHTASSSTTTTISPTNHIPPYRVVHMWRRTA